MARVLIIDDDELIRRSFGRLFEQLGHTATDAGTLAQGLDLARNGVDVVYLDINLPDGDGHKAISRLAESPGHPEVIVVTGLSDNYGAEETMQSGAWDYIQKPASPAAIRASLESALGYRNDRTQKQNPPADVRPPFDDGGILGSHASMLRAKESIRKAARSDAGVLILGETGVGKELAAHAIHHNSGRAGGPFVIVDCSNLTESLLESVLYGHVKGAFTGAHADHKGLVAQSHGGTLFLDEVGELSTRLQKSFLRVLQEHRYRPVGATREETSDFRLVAATNRNLERMTARGTFRADLLFRLRTIEFSLPPLRNRGSDILHLAEHFARAACERYNLPIKQFSELLDEVLTCYGWPGNVRELGNAIEATVVEAGEATTLYPKHLPSHIRVSCLNVGREQLPAPTTKVETEVATESPMPDATHQPSYAEHKAAADKHYFGQLMEACNYNVTEASRISGLSVPSVYRYLSMAGIPTKKRG